MPLRFDLRGNAAQRRQTRCWRRRCSPGPGRRSLRDVAGGARMMQLPSGSQTACWFLAKEYLTGQCLEAVAGTPLCCAVLWGQLYTSGGRCSATLLCSGHLLSLTSLVLIVSRGLSTMHMNAVQAGWIVPAALPICMTAPLWCFVPDHQPLCCLLPLSVLPGELSFMI